jgi:hypothetical protein
VRICQPRLLSRLSNNFRLASAPIVGDDRNNQIGPSNA